MTDPAELDPRVRQALDEVLARDEPVPAHVRAAARGAFGLRVLDTEVADLTFDSARDDLVGVRSEHEHVRVFTSGELSVELRDGVGSADIEGRLLPPVAGTFLVLAADACAGGSITASGTFHFARPAGVFTLRVGLGDRVVDTEPVEW
jgi:hypothetical protein